MDIPLPAPKKKSLRASIESKHGSKVKRIGVIKRAGIVTDSIHFTRLLKHYLDESKKAPSLKNDGGDIARPDYASSVVSGNAPQRPGKDYVKSESGVKIFGYLNDLIATVSVNPEKLTEAEKVQILKDNWIKKRIKHVKKAHHIIFSIDPKVAAALGELGVSVDEILHAAIAEAMCAYNNRYYREYGSIGWVTGIHHDRHHIHAHVLVYPTTSEGKGLNMSDRAPVNVNGKTIRVNFFDPIRDTYYDSLERLVGVALAPITPKKATAKDAFIQMGGMIDACFESIEKKGEQKPTPALVIKKMAEFVREDDAVSAVNQAIQSHGSLMDPRSVQTLLERTEYFKKLIVQRRDEHDQAVAKLTATKNKVARIFAEYHASPDLYRGVQPVPGMIVQSPSGSKSFLEAVSGFSKGKLIRPTLQETQSILTRRNERLDALLERHRAELPIEPILSESYSQDVFTRNGEIALFTREVRDILERVSTGHSLDVSDYAALKKLHWLTPEQVREIILSSFNKASRTIAFEQRTATAQELISLHDQREINKLIKDLDISNTPDDLSVTTQPIILPTTSNFLEREANRAGLRSLEEMRQQTDALFKQVSASLKWTPRESTPHWI